MIIAQISDTHIALDTPDADQRIADFERAIADINSLDPQPDLIVHSGDIVQNGRRDEYAVTASILANANAPVYVMVGNKDDRANLRETFPVADYLNTNADFIAYSVEHLPVRLVMLDTLNPGSRKGEFCDARVAGFEDMLGVETDKPVAIFAHHPPFMVPEGPEPLHFETNEVMDRLRLALQRAPSVVGMFCGHVHRGVAGHVGDIPVMVVQCIATPLRRGEYPAEMTTCPVYHIHRFDLDGNFTTESRIVTA